MGVDACMVLDVPDTGITPLQVNTWAYDMAAAIGAWEFSTDAAGKWGEPRLALTAVTEYDQDGPTLFPDTGRTFLEVHLAGRYYGPGYERGNPWVPIAVAEWAERNIPGVRILYGGDSSGICAEPFGPRERAELIGHWARYGHDPYSRGFDLGADSVSPPAPCALCPRPPIRNGWGAGYAAYWCPGCGRHVSTSDHGKTYTDKRRE